MILARLTLEQKVDLILGNFLGADGQAALINRLLPRGVAIDRSQGNLVILTYKDQVFHLMLFSRESFVANVIATLLWVDEVDKIPVESP